MCRSDRMSIWAYEQAVLSDCHFKHGAIITKGAKIIVKGRNTQRTQFLNTHAMCLHAEIDVARKLLNCYIIGKKRSRKSNNYKIPKYNLSKYIIWVVRASATSSICNTNIKLKQSSPCAECITMLLSLGFKKIGFSDSNGNMIVTNIRNCPGYLSNAQKNYNKIRYT